MESKSRYHMEREEGGSTPPKKEKIIPPVDRVERVVSMAEQSKFWREAQERIHQYGADALLLEDLTQYAEQNPDSPVGQQVIELLKNWRDAYNTSRSGMYKRTLEDKVRMFFSKTEREAIEKGEASYLTAISFLESEFIARARELGAKLELIKANQTPSDSL